MQQRFQASTCLRHQTVANASKKPFLVGTDRCSYDAVNAISRRRFDQQLAAARLEPRHQVVGNRAHHCCLIPKPIFERLGVSNRRLAIAEEGTDLGTMTFRRSAPTGSVHRPRARERGFAGRPPPAICRSISEPANGNRPRSRKNSSKHGEAQPVGTALDRDPVRDRPASVSRVRGGSIPRECSPGDDSAESRRTRGLNPLFTEGVFC